MNNYIRTFQRFWKQYLGTNIVVWAVVEPILGVTNIELQQSDWTIRLIAYLGLILVIAVINLFLSRQRTLEKFSFSNGDTSLLSCWQDHFDSNTARGTITREVITDGYYGKVLKLTHQNGQASDCPVSDFAKGGSTVTFVTKPEESLILYIRLRLTSKFGNESKAAWIVLDKRIKESFRSKNNEWHYPVKLTPLNNGFVKCKVNIKDMVSKTHGLDNWQFHSFECIRCRGTTLIESITITT